MCNGKVCDAASKFDPTLSDGSHPNFHTLALSGDRERAADWRWRTLSADDRSELRLEDIDLGRQLNR